MLSLYGVKDGFGQCYCDEPGANVVGSEVNVLNLSDAISQQILLPMPIASLTPQTLCVKGTFLINEDYEFTSSTITMDRNANINVLSFNGFIVRNSDIFGCDYMWGSVTISSNAQFEISGSTIKDGINAINPKFRSSIIIQDNNFINNFICINVLSKSPSPTIGIVFQPDVLEGNRFETEGSGLLPPYANETGLAGIYLNGVLGFTVGTTNTDAQPNIFTRLHTGVIAERSSVNIHNSDFSNILTDGLPPGNIPFGSGTSIGTFRTFGDLITDCRFTNGSSGINNREFRSVEINGCTMFNPMRRGIRARNSNDAELIIQENDISANRDAITVEQLGGQGVLDISDQINITRDGFPGVNHPAVWLNSCNFPPENARVSLNPITIINSRNALTIGGCSNILFEQNDISLIGAPSSNLSDGISVNSSNHLVIADNSVDGTLATDSQRGIIVGNAGVLDHVSFCCNTLINTAVGVDFDGIQMFTHLNGTTFGDHDIGLLYRENAIINPQPDAGNLWTGTYSDVGARHEGLILNDIQFSKYDVRFQGDELPPSIDVVNFPNEPWFYSSNDFPFSCQVADGCEIIIEQDPPVDNLVISVADGTLQTGTIYENTLVWQAERSVFRQIEATPTWLQNQTLLTFYNAKQGTTVDLFNDIEERIEALRDIKPTEIQAFKDNQDEIQFRLRELMKKDSLLWDANPVDSAALVLEIKDLQMEMMDLGLESDSLYSIVMDNRIIAIQGMITDNDAITTSTIYEQNEKTVNDIWLNTVAQNNYTLTPTQISNLESIVGQCPLMGGGAVYTARGLYQMEVDTIFNDDILCTPPPQNMIGNNEIEHLAAKYLFPNPANQSVTLTLEETFETESEMVIMDLNGKVIKRFMIAPASFKYQFSVQDFPNGFYLCHFINNDETIFSEKLIVTH